MQITTEFVGYDQLTLKSDVTAMTTETEVVDALTEEIRVRYRCQTPFSMQQWVVRKGDKGIIKTENGKFVVEDTVKLVAVRFGM